MTETLVTAKQYEQMLATVQTMRWKQGDLVPQSYRTVLEAFRWTACHTSALSSTPTKGPPTIQQEGTVWFMQWHRPKTAALCLAPIPDGLVEPLRAYLAGERLGIRQLQNVIREIGLASGLAGSVTPRSFRKLRAVEVSQQGGTGTAKRVLGVSDRTLAKYAVLGDKEAVLRLSVNLPG